MWNAVRDIDGCHPIPLLPRHGISCCVPESCRAEPCISHLTPPSAAVNGQATRDTRPKPQQKASNLDCRARLGPSRLMQSCRDKPPHPSAIGTLWNVAVAWAFRENSAYAFHVHYQRVQAALSAFRERFLSRSSVFRPNYSVDFYTSGHKTAL